MDTARTARRGGRTAVLIGSAIIVLVAVVWLLARDDGGETEVDTRPAGSSDELDEREAETAEETPTTAAPDATPTTAASPAWDAEVSDAGATEDGPSVSSPPAAADDAGSAEDYWTEERMDDAEPSMPTPGPADPDTGPSAGDGEEGEGGGQPGTSDGQPPGQP